MQSSPGFCRRLKRDGVGRKWVHYSSYLVNSHVVCSARYRMLTPCSTVLSEYQELLNEIEILDELCIATYEYSPGTALVGGCRNRASIPASSLAIYSINNRLKHNPTFSSLKSKVTRVRASL